LGFPYASLGLVWGYAGPLIVDNLYGTEVSASNVARIVDDVDQHFCTPIDAADNGIHPEPSTEYGPLYPITISRVVANINRSPRSDPSRDLQEKFRGARHFMGEMLEHAISAAYNRLADGTHVGSALATRQDKRIIVLGRGVGGVSEHLKRFGDEDVLFVVFPNSDDIQSQSAWVVGTVSKGDGLPRRALLPESWAALQGAELDAVTGCTGGVFCHKDRFIAGARTYECAYDMAKIAAASALVG
jgi:uncharacterized UPF0160 family protein